MKEIINPNMTMGKAKIPIDKVNLREYEDGSFEIRANTKEGNGYIQLYQGQPSVIIYDYKNKKHLKKIYPISFLPKDGGNFIDKQISFRPARAKDIHFPIPKYLVSNKEYYKEIDKAIDLCTPYAPIAEHWHFHVYSVIAVINKYLQSVKFSFQFDGERIETNHLIRIKKEYIDMRGMLYISIEAVGIGRKKWIWDIENDLNQFETGGLIDGEGDTWQTIGLNYVIPLHKLTLDELLNN